MSIDLPAARAEMAVAMEAIPYAGEVTVTPCPVGRRTDRLLGSPAAGTWLFYVHGGAFALGSAEMYCGFVSHLVDQTRDAAWIVDYPLAPEHPYPAALDAVGDSYRALLGRGVDRRRIVLAGDSAGGGLALSLLIDLRARGVPLPAATVLMSPWLDLSLTGATIHTNAGTDHVLDEPDLRYFAGAYVGTADPGLPTLAPLDADLGDLPDILIQVGGREILLDDSTRLAARASAVGTDVALEIVEDAQHNFQLAVGSNDVARAAVARIARLVSNLEIDGCPARELLM